MTQGALMLPFPAQDQATAPTGTAEQEGASPGPSAVPSPDGGGK